MKIKPRMLALASAVCAIVALPAHALLISSSTVALSGSWTVTDSCGNPNIPAATFCSNGSATESSAETSSLLQFSPSAGVLLDASIKLDSAQTQSLFGLVTNINGFVSTVTTFGSGGLTTTLSAPGVIESLSFSISGSSAQAQLVSNFNIPQVIAENSVSNSLGINNLGAYVGNGNVPFNLNSSFQANTTWESTPTAKVLSYATYSSEGTDTVTAIYDYLQHANGQLSSGSHSGSVVNLNFGTVDHSTLTPPTLDFFLSNLAGDRVGLDLDSITSSGDSGVLKTDLASLTSLTPGSKSGFTASIDTSNVGDYIASYVLHLSDANVGVESTRNDYTLTLNLRGTVSDIPEPGLLGLLSIGLLGLVKNRRKS